MTDKLAVSVVIPTYNRLDTLRAVIPSLIAQDVRPDVFEVIVADSLSTDGTAAYLADIARTNPNVRHLPGPYTGRASARNAGIDAALAPLILFTDADIMASPDLLSKHLARHASGRKAVVGCEIQVDSFDAYLRKRRDSVHEDALHPPTRKRLSWLYFMTGNASVLRADLHGVGRFDEDFTGYGHEDLELGYRLQRAGIPIEYAAEAVNYHWHPVPFDQQQGRMELAGRSTVRFYRKHRTFDVQLRLGMTPLSIALHDAIDRIPGARSWLDYGARKPGFVRTLSFQYHYLSGIKAALRDPS